MPSEVAAPAASVRGAGVARQVWRALTREPLGMAGFILVVLIVGSVVFADLLVPHDPNQIMAGSRLAPPTAEHWLGTDQLGRDLFSRVIMGGRVALQVALASLTAALSLGILLGLTAAFGPRWLDTALLLVFDAVRSFPIIIFALAVITLLGSGLYTIVLVVAVTSTPIYARIVRTQAQSIRHNEFIVAERAMGAGTGRILGVHVLPNVIGPLLILASMDVPIVITLEADHRVALDQRAVARTPIRART